MRREDRSSTPCSLLSQTTKEAREQLGHCPLVQQVAAPVALPAEATRRARSNGVREDPEDHGLGDGRAWSALLIHIWIPFRFVT